MVVIAVLPATPATLGSAEAWIGQFNTLERELAVLSAIVVIGRKSSHVAVFRTFALPIAIPVRLGQCGLAASGDACSKSATSELHQAVLSAIVMVGLQSREG